MEKVLEAAKVPKLKLGKQQQRQRVRTHPAPLGSLLSKRRSTEPESGKQATDVLFALAQG